MQEHQLSGTVRTLLMPLWGRAKATRANSRLHLGIEIVEEFGIFSKLSEGDYRITLLTIGALGLPRRLSFLVEGLEKER